MTTDLIEALRANPGSRRLWADWYKRVRPPVYYAAFRFTRGNRPAAEDLVQETFMRFLQYEAIQRVSNETHALAFLVRTCRNLAIDRDRGAREIPIHDIPEIQLPEPSDEPIETALDVEEALQVLTPEDRQLILWVLEGLSLADIATRQGISYTAAGVRLYRIRKHLQQKLGSK